MGKSFKKPQITEECFLSGREFLNGRKSRTSDPTRQLLAQCRTDPHGGLRLRAELLLQLGILKSFPVAQSPSFLHRTQIPLSQSWPRRHDEGAVSAFGDSPASLVKLFGPLLDDSATSSSWPDFLFSPQQSSSH